VLYGGLADCSGVRNLDLNVYQTKLVSNSFASKNLSRFWMGESVLPETCVKMYAVTAV
jgi:hypothetical protein